MNTPFEFESEAEAPIVYVRAVKVADLPKDLQKQAADAEQLYAVHDMEGSRLALVSDCEMAFVLARQHNMNPVFAH
jgi:hypothetical protein